MNKDSKIFVAGHRGLVGSAIMKSLLESGYSNLIIKTREELDLLNSNAVADFFNKEKPEYVFLAAAKVGGIMANNIYRADFIYENLVIQNNIVHQSYINKVKKLLFLGSTCIYPKEAPQPLKEDYLLTDVLEYTNEPYAIAKIAGIKLCESYNIQYKTNFISVMPTNLYGPGDNFDLEKSHVLPALLRKIHLGRLLEDNDWEGIRKDLHKLPIGNITGNSPNDEIIAMLADLGIKQVDDKVCVEIWGSGKPMREFMWSEDMAKACIFIMNNVDFSHCLKENESEIRNTHINIGTGNDIMIKDLSLIIKKELKFQGGLVFNTAKPDGTMKKLTDVSKLNSLGWKHEVDLNEGIKKLYSWYLSE